MASAGKEQDTGPARRSRSLKEDVGPRGAAASTEIVLRTFKPPDEDRVRELTIESFHGVSIDHNFDRISGWDRSPDWRERKWVSTRQVIASFPDDSFVAELEGRVVGYIACALSEASSIGRIMDMAVDPGMRRKGVGTLLIERALVNFEKKGMALAKIETLTQNQAGASLYPKLGFREVARQIHYMMELPRKPRGSG